VVFETKKDTEEDSKSKEKPQDKFPKKIRTATPPCLFSYAEECRNIDDIVDSNRLKIKNVFFKVKKVQTNKEESKSPIKELNIPKVETGKIHDEKPEEAKVKEEDNGIYVAKLVIVRLFDSPNSISKSYMLSHAFTEPFNIIQIFIKDKENLAYTLCCVINN
jgi:hypothetical protein